MRILIAVCVAGLGCQPGSENSSNASNCAATNSCNGGGEGGTGGSADPDAGGAEGADGAPMGTTEHPIVVIAPGGDDLGDGDRYFTPLGQDSGAATIPLFSVSPDFFEIENRSDAGVLIRAIEFVPHDGHMAEEFVLINGDRTAFEVADHMIAPGERLMFPTEFMPVQGGARSATLKITYDDGATFDFELAGTGRTEAAFFSHGSPAFSRVYGGVDSDELLTGLAVDEAGNAYFAGNVSQVVDGFSLDIFVGRVNADGGFGWGMIYDGGFRDESRDPGQNGESGGGADAIRYHEGHVYLAGASSPTNHNSVFQGWVTKLDAETGAVAWKKAWRPAEYGSPLARHGAQFYGMQVTDGTVYLTGTSGADLQGSEAFVVVVGLDIADGSVRFQKAFEVHPTLNDRGYSLAVDDSGGAYVVGNGNGRAFVMRVEDLAGDASVAWIQRVELGLGGNINSVDVDDAGNLYLSCDIRGATTYFTGVSLAPDGALRWGKQYAASGNDQNNTHVVRVHGDSVYFGGRIGLSEFDTQMGDGLLLKLATDDGSERWSMFHYTGKGPEELAEHRVKGVGIAGDSLWVAGQVYTGNHNGLRYAGYWYDGLGTVEDFAPELSPVPIPEGDEALVDVVGGHTADAAGGFQSMPPSVVFQDAYEKHDGASPDSDVFLTRFDLAD